MNISEFCCGVVLGRFPEKQLMTTVKEKASGDAFGARRQISVWPYVAVFSVQTSREGGGAARDTGSWPRSAPHTASRPTEQAGGCAHAG